MLNIRHLTSANHAPIIRVLDDWWGGRHMNGMLPRLFFTHFSNTSFIAEDGQQIAGFLVGLFSPAYADEAYIHFVGVNPAHRKAGVGCMPYERFFTLMHADNCHIVRCVTSPINTTSIAFHTCMGCMPEPSSTANADSVPYAADYDGPGEHRVLFSKQV